MSAQHDPDNDWSNWDQWEAERLANAKARDRGTREPRRADLGQRRKAQTLLPSNPPPAGTPSGEVLQWLTVAFALGGDPITAVTRFGRHDDAPLVIALRSGGRIRYDRQADVFNADALVRRVVLSTGAETPAYGKADTHRIAGAVVRAAEIVEQADDRAEARDWARTFLEVAHHLDELHDMDTPAGRYAGLLTLRDWRPTNAAPYATAAERAAVLHDTRGRQYVRVSAFAAHVRALAGRPISWPTLHGRMAEIGWRGGFELEQRQPRGDKKVKLHVYGVPAGWTDA